MGAFRVEHTTPRPASGSRATSLLRTRDGLSNVSLTEVVVSEAPPQAFASRARTPTGLGHPSILFSSPNSNPMTDPTASTEAAPVLVAARDGVAHVRLNRPPLLILGVTTNRSLTAALR